MSKDSDKSKFENQVSAHKGSTDEGSKQNAAENQRAASQDEKSRARKKKQQGREFASLSGTAGVAHSEAVTGAIVEQGERVPGLEADALFDEPSKSPASESGETDTAKTVAGEETETAGFAAATENEVSTPSADQSSQPVPEKPGGHTYESFELGHPASLRGDAGGASPSGGSATSGPQQTFSAAQGVNLGANQGAASAQSGTGPAAGSHSSTTGAGKIPYAQGVQADLTEDASANIAQGELEHVRNVEGFQAQTLANAYGTLHVDADGHWEYALDNTRPATQALRDGERVETVFHLTAKDGTQHDIRIDVHGTNDAAQITGIDSGVAVDSGQASVLHAPGQLKIQDVDQGEAHFQPEVIVGKYGSFLTVAKDGAWDYSVDRLNPHVLGLKQGEELKESFTVHAADGTAHTVTLTVEGGNTPAIIAGKSADVLIEDGGRDAASGQLNVLDPDQGQNTFQTEIQSGTYGTLSIDVQGQWHYQLDNSLQTTQALRGGQSAQDVFFVKSADGTPHAIQIDVLGSNDAAAIDGIDSGLVKEDGQTMAGMLVVSNHLQVMDVDSGESLFPAQVYQGQYGQLSLANDGTWTYMASNANPKIQALAQGEQLSESFIVHSADGTTHSVNVQILGTNDAPVLDAIAGAKTLEDGALVQGQLTVQDTDSRDTHLFSASNLPSGFVLNPDGSYSFDPTHPDYQHLPDGRTQSFAIPVVVTDGHGGLDTKTLHLTITGTNDAAQITGVNVGQVSESAHAPHTLKAGGKLDIVDTDDGEASFKPEVLGGQHGGFLHIEVDGNWHYSVSRLNPDIVALQHGQSLKETFTVHAVDGTQKTITMTIQGDNEPAIISGTSAGIVQEDKAAPMDHAEGQLVVMDPDKSDVGFQAETQQGRFGQFQVDANGHWSYTLDNSLPETQALREHQSESEVFFVKSADGTPLGVQVMVMGSPDAAQIGGSNTGLVTEDQDIGGRLTSTGALTISDADAGEALFPAQSLTGQYGNLHLSNNGQWAYIADNAQTAIQALGENEHLDDTFTVRSLDGTQHTIKVTIEGTNDTPVLQTQSQSVKEDGSVLHGHMQVSDTDTSDTHSFSPVTNVPGFVLNNDGSYTFDPTDAAYQSLPDGQQKVLTIPVTVTDSAGGQDTQDLVITVSGTGDAAVITGTSVGDVTEDLNPYASVNGNYAYKLEAQGHISAIDPDSGESGFDFSTLVSAPTHPEWAPYTSALGGQLTIDRGSNWHYYIDNRKPEIQSLGNGQTLTDTVQIASKDGTTHTITVTIHGTNDAPTVGSAVTLTQGTEDTAYTLHASDLLANASDIDKNDAGQLQVANLSADHGSITDNHDGTYTFTPDADYNGAVQFSYDVQDAHGGSTATSASLDLAAVADAAVITGGGAHLKEDVGIGTGTNGYNQIGTHGQLTIVDPDGPAQSQFPDALHGGIYTGNLGGKLQVNSNGSYFYNLDNGAVNHLAEGQEAKESFTIHSVDGTTHTVEFVIEGTNDAPYVRGAATLSAGIEDTAVTLHVADLLAQAGDYDDGETAQLSVHKLSADHGTITDNKDGTYTFTPDTDYNGPVHFTYDVQDPQGATVAASASMTLNAVADAAVIAGQDTGSITEDRNVGHDSAQSIQIMGSLSVTDPDAGQDHFIATNPMVRHEKVISDPFRGELHIDRYGNWDYRLANGNPTLQALKAGETRDVIYEVRSADGTTHRINITVHGTNDAPVIAGNSARTTPDDDTGVTGALTISDADTGQSHFVAQTDTDGTYGKFSIDAQGRWSYTPDGRADAIQVGQAPQEHFEVTTADGTKHTITVTVTGSSEITLGGDTSGTAIEDTTPTISGDLVLTDPSTGSSSTPHFGDHVMQGTYGELDLRDQGHWIYRLNNQDPVVQGLRANQTEEEHFHITLPDGTTQDVVIQVSGTHDQPQIQTLAQAPAAVLGQVAQVTEFTGATDLSMFPEVAQGVATGHRLVGLYMPGDDHNKLDGIASASLPVLQTAYKPTAGSGFMYMNTNRWFSQHIPDVDSHAVAPSVRNNWDGGLAVFDDGTVVRLVKVCDGQSSSEHDYMYFKRVDGISAQTGVTTLSGDAAAGRTVEVFDGSTHLGTATADNNGHWVLGVPKLSDGDHSIHTTVDGHATDPQTLTVAGSQANLHAPEPVIGSVTEDAATATLNGQMQVADADIGDHPTFTTQHSTSGKYGSFSIDQQGNWHYTLDNTRAATGALKTGQSAQETFIVEVTTDSGEHTQTSVHIVVQGHDDQAVISDLTPQRQAITEDQHVQPSGIIETGQNRLSIVDPDGGEALFVPTGTVRGTGSAATGSWVGGDKGVGQFILHADGRWFYKVDNDNAQINSLADGDTFTETLTIHSADGTSHALTVTVHGSNDVPTISAQTLSGTEDQTYTFSAADFGFQDVDAGASLDHITITALPDAHEGALTLNGNALTQGQAISRADIAHLVFTPAKDVDGDVHFTYTVNDGSADSAPAQATIALAGTPDAPEISGVTDLGSTLEDTSVTWTTAQLLANASDVDTPASSLSVVGLHVDPQYGSVQDNGDGTYTFTPAKDFAADSIPVEYSVSDGTQSTPAHAVIGVTAVADAPVSSMAESVQTDFAAPSISGHGGSWGLVDPSVWGWKTDSASGVEHGKGSAYGDTSGGNVGIVELEGVAGEASNLYRDIQTQPGAEYHLEFKLSGRTGVTGNSADVQVIWEGKVIATLHPKENAFGFVTHDFDLVATSDTSRIELRAVTQDGSGPVIDDLSLGFGGLSGTEDTELPLKVNMQLQDTDGSETLGVTVKNLPVGFALTDGVHVAQVLNAGDELDAQGWDLDHLAIRPAANFAGQVNVVVSATATESSNQDSASVDYPIQLDFSGTPDAAVITDSTPGRQEITEDLHVQSSGIIETDQNRLSIVDPDGGEALFVPTGTVRGTGSAATGSWVGGDKGVGQFIMHADGRWFYKVDNDNAQINSLADGDTFTETLTIHSADGTSHVLTVTVHGSNDVPTISAQTLSGTEDQTYTFSAADFGFQDVDAGASLDHITITALPDPHEGLLVLDGGQLVTAHQNIAVADIGKLQFIPLLNFSGDSGFRYSVSDGTADSAPVLASIHIADVPDSAVIKDSTPLRQQITEDQNVQPSGIIGTDQNRLSIVDPDGGEALFVPTGTVRGTGSAATGSWVGGDKGVGQFIMHADGRWFYKVDNDNAQINSLADGDTFTETLTIHSADGTSHVLTVTVHGSNDAPSITSAVSLPAGTEDTAVTLTSAQLLANAVDVDQGETAQLSIENLQADHGTITNNNDGTFTFTPDADYNGAVQFTYDVQDPHGAKVASSASMNLAAENDAPQLTTAAGATVKEDASIGQLDSGWIDLEVQDKDGVGEEKVIKVEINGVQHTVPADFAMDIKADHGVFHFTHNSITGHDRWRYSADNTNTEIQGLKDGQSLTDHAYLVTADGTRIPLTATISGADDDVVIDTQDSSHGPLGTAIEDTGTSSVSGTFLAHDTDADDSVSFKAQTIQDSYGTLTVSADGTWTYALDHAKADNLKAGQTVPRGFDIEAISSDGSTTTKHIQINVQGSNDAPTVTATRAAPVELGSTAEDTPKTFTETALLHMVGAADADAGDALHVTAISSPHGSFTHDTVSGDWTFTPAANYKGDDLAVEVKVSDGTTVTTAHGTIDVTPVTDAPSPSLTIKAEQQVMTFDSSSASAIFTNEAVNAGGAMHGFAIEMTVIGGQQVASAGIHGATLMSYETAPHNDEIYVYKPDSLTVKVGGHEYDTGIAIPGDGHDHRLSVVWDGTQGTLDLLIDGNVAKHMTGVAQGYTVPDGGALAFGGDQDSMRGGFSTNDAFNGQIFSASMASQSVDPTQLQRASLGHVLDGDAHLLTNIQVANGQVTDQTGQYTYGTHGSYTHSSVEVDTAIANPNPGALLKLSLDAGAPADTDDHVSGRLLNGFPSGTVVSDGHGHSVTVSGPGDELDVSAWSHDSLQAQLPASYHGNLQIGVAVTTEGPDGSTESATDYAGVTLDPTQSLPTQQSFSLTVAHDAPMLDTPPTDTVDVSLSADAPDDASAGALHEYLAVFDQAGADLHAPHTHASSADAVPDALADMVPSDSADTASPTDSGLDPAAMADFLDKQDDALHHDATDHSVLDHDVSNPADDPGTGFDDPSLWRNDDQQ